MKNAPDILPIIRWPAPILLQKCAPAKDPAALAALADAMRATMLEARGVGLAAPQVGRAVRLIVADVSPARDRPLAIVNPQIVRAAGAQTSEEGCLSLPGGLTAPVARAAEVRVTGSDLQGRPLTCDADGLLAICLQHEIDHLDGILFFHRISRLRRARLLAKYGKIRREEEEAAKIAAA